MAQRRAQGSCPHGDAGRRPYPVWLKDGSDIDPARDAALANLETALTACSHALAPAAAALTTQDVRQALKAVPLELRPKVLLPLGLTLKPRQISQGLCQDVRGRLARADDHALHHALAALGKSALLDLRRAAVCDEFPPEVAEDLGDPVAHWGAALCRSTVWAAALSSIVDARLWQWAAQQPWFAPDGVTAEQVAAIFAAAEHVIDLTPDHMQLPPADVASRADAEVHAADAAPSESALTESTTTMTASVPATIDAATSSALLAAANAFDAALIAAVPAADRIATALRDKYVPLPEDVQLVALVRQRFDEAAELAAAAGHRIAQDSAAALHAAVAAVGADAGDDDVRCLLEAVLGLAAPDNSPLTPALQAAQQQATALLARRPWDDVARADAHVLSLLVALTSADLDATSRLELITQVAQTSPALAGLAVQADQLSAPAPPEPVPAATAGTAPAPTDTVAEAVTTEAPLAAAPTTPTAQAEPLVAAAPEPPPVAPVASLAPPTQVPDELPASETAKATDELDEMQVEGGLATLVAANRFGLAAAVCAADDEAPVRKAALRIAALAKVVRHQNGPVAAALRDEFNTLDADTVAADVPSLLLTVPSLVRAALVTGEPTIGALLTDLAPRVEPNLSAIAEEIGQRTLKGVLLDAQALSVVADVTEAERDLHTIMTTAHQVRTRHRTLRFKRATDISKILLSQSGVLGKPLATVEHDDRSALNDVAADLARLTTSSYLRDTIDKLDRRFQGASGKPIEGAGRQDLLNLVSEALSPLADWVETVRAIGVQESRGQHWSAAEIAKLRTLVLDRATAALVALETQLSHPDALTAAAARAAHASLKGTFAVLDGTGPLPPGEPSPQQALTVELLRIPGATVDVALGAVTAPAGTTATDLLAAAHRDWDASLHAQIAAENFEAAYFLLTASASGRLPAIRSKDGTLDDVALTLTHADVTAAEKAVRQQLTEDRELFSATLRRARLNNEISDEQDGELAGLLRDAHTGLLRDAHTGFAPCNLGAVRTILDRAAELLPSYRAEAKSRLTDRLRALRIDGRVDDATMARLENLMDDGQLSTAEELIYFLEIYEDVPEVYQSEDLQRFFPAVPDALPRGITPELAQFVSARGTLPACPVLDFSDLSPDFAALASDALNTWRLLSVADADQRTRIDESEMIAPALRLIGLEAHRHNRLDDLPRSSDRRFVEFPFEDILGQALVPAFGSKLGNQLRVLLAWGQPSADLLMSWADTDPSGESLLIAHFGTMSAQTRRDLAVKAAGRPAPIVVLDDAALAYLAAHGNRQMAATMNALLPFSSINPYLRQKRGVVAPEMFYGRDAERRSVLDPDGTQLVFGGRGLGKSALLNSAADQFEKQASVGERIAVYLDLKAVGIRPGSAINQEAIWDELLAVLARRKLITATGRSGRNGKPWERVRAGVQAWIDGDQRRRLLVLLDEADQFFEADMPDFMETTRLKDLGQENKNRVKVVFAGLHSVQRYAKRARNAPFGHMAQRPTVIGPLRPQHAANLLTRPMAALGFDFEDPDLVNRILGFCSYQPFLLQIFANRLIEALHDKRGADGLGDTEPPYVIARSDVEAVETHADLRADIRTAFHETLNLDHRYGVIAHVLAQHAHESGLDARLTDAQLREDCLSYWSDGFAKLDVEGFRAYLQEMTGLGVLAPNIDGRGWHLRSANVLSMIGTRDDVEAQLVSAAELSVPDEFLALESRLELATGGRSPLTASQIDDVLGDHANQVRVVIGSVATGIDHVTSAVKEAADVGSRFVVPPVSNRRQFEEQLVAGKPGERRVVVDDLYSLAPSDDSCAQALDAARTSRPTASGVTRSAVIVAGPDQMDLWREVFTAQSSTTGARSAPLAVSTVTLRRYDAASLRACNGTRCAVDLDV